MSSRVCLHIALAWLALAAPAAAQVGARPESPAPGPAGGAAATTQSHDAEPVELVSNAPRSVSYAREGADPKPAGASTRGGARGDGAGGDPAAAMPLPPRSQTQRRRPGTASGSSSGRALMTVLSSLAIVLVVFFAFVWVTRTAAPKGMAPLSKEVVESLGRAPLLGRQQMQLIRVGNKLILLSVTNNGADTLTEITDPVEVDRLAGLCRQAQSGSISDTFRQVLAQAAVEPTASSRTTPQPPDRSGALEAYRA